MKDEKQIVLFIKKGFMYDNTKLASMLNEQFTELGNPVVIPFDTKHIDQPLIIFNQGKILLTMNYNDVSIIYRSNDDMFDLTMNIIDFLEENDFDFIRFGYISTHICTDKERENFIENTFKNSEAIKADFNLSWYSKELIDSVSVNVWQRKLTDFANKVPFVSIFDINTPIDEEYNISSEFVNNFIKKCDKYIEKKEKEMFK